MFVSRLMVELDMYLAINLIGAFQAWLVFGVLTFQRLTNREINRAFLLLILSIAVSLTSKLFFNQSTFEAAPRLWYFLDTAVFLFLPLWYKVLLIGLGKKDNTILSKVVLSSASFQILFLISTLHLTAEELARYSNYKSFYGFLITLAVSGTYFLTKSWLLIRNAEEEVIPKGVRIGQMVLSVLLALGVLLTVYAVLNDYSLGSMLRLYSWMILVLAFSMVLVGVAFTSMPKEFALIALPFPGKPVESLQGVADSVSSLIEKEKKYLQPKLSLQEVASTIQVNPVITSKAINQVIGVPFPDYVNQLRVQHFVKLARDSRNKEYTHWALAQESGFGNKVSFYKSFKKVYQKTPKEYLEKV